MKKMFMTLMLVIAAVAQVMAMSSTTIRKHARFLSDRMAYELDLTPYQYEDVYEINYDFIHSIDRVMDDVVYGYRDAIDRYYHMLDYRNEDLRYVLNARQYAKFVVSDYFYRPVYSTGRSWNFRIYTIYNNRNFFYYDAPVIYGSYRGGHSSGHYNHDYYSKRHQYDSYGQQSAILGSNRQYEHGRSDFGENRKDRGNKKQNEINNYKNPKQNNRTNDPRYQDNSGNKNSPQINNHGGAVSGRR